MAIPPNQSGGKKMSIIIDGGEIDDTPIDEHQILYNRGIAHYIGGKYDQAINDLETVLKIICI
jgi:outer membrane protein assembly factor BamD (BamD/ComL family)